MAAASSVNRMMSDVQFLAHPPSEFADHAIYLYRQNSWILKHKVRRCILALAQDRNWTVLPQEGGLYASSVFDAVLFVCDLGQKDAYQPASDDIERTLLDLAAGGLDRHIFLMVPADHRIVGTDAWKRAISASNAAYIEEPIVTRANLAGLMEQFASVSDLSKLAQLARTRAFRDHFSRFIPKSGCTVSEISMEIDRFVLLRMAEAPSKKPDHSLVVHRQTIDIALRGFLDRQNEAALRKVLVHVDRLLFADMLDRSEVIARIYSTTASIVGGRDRRYKNRDPANWNYYAWGMLVLSCDWSGAKDERRGGFLVAFERICREFMTVVDPQAWLQRTDRWQKIAGEIARPADADPRRMEQARLDLIGALQERSAPLSASYKWLDFSSWIDVA